MEVSKNIRSIRESKGLTQVDMASKMGTERSNYARLENRGINLTLKQIQEIADALQVSVYEIIGTPQNSDVKSRQAETIQQLEEKLKMTEDVLRHKRHNIKLYKSFIEWTRDKITSHFRLSVIFSSKQLGIRDIEIESFEDQEYELAIYNFTEVELKQIGKYMFDYESPQYFLNEFVASSGFVTDKWFIDAYKSKARERKEKINFSELKNWVNGVFEFLEEE